MSVFSDASAAVGVPAWAVPVCIGILALAKLVDSSIRPEAKAQIGDFLDHGRIPEDPPGIVRVVRTAFLATFGERQFSWRCLSRTVLLSVFTVYAIVLIVWAKHGAAIRSRMPDLPSVPEMMLAALPGVLLVALVLDWVSVGKSRVILGAMRDRRGLAALAAFMVLDLVLTYLLAVFLYWGPHLSAYGPADLCATLQYYDAGADCTGLGSMGGALKGILGVSAAMVGRFWADAGSLTPGNILNLAIGFAALLTSVWTVGIVLALALLRLLMPLGLLRRAMRWGWDLRAAPVMAVGWSLATLVWVGSLAYAVL